MKTKHTPGPWSVSVYDKRGKAHPQNNNCYYSVATRDGEPIHIPSKKEANAHLIAAAPELLEALNSIFLRCSFNHVTDWQELRKEIGELAGQAIAKAEGWAK